MNLEHKSRVYRVQGIVVSYTRGLISRAIAQHTLEQAGCAPEAARRLLDAAQQNLTGVMG